MHALSQSLIGSDTLQPGTAAQLAAWEQTVTPSAAVPVQYAQFERLSIACAKRRCKEDRDTEAQRHRGTETQRHRGTEAQRHRGTEAQRHRDTETQRHRGTYQLGDGARRHALPSQLRRDNG